MRALPIATGTNVPSAPNRVTAKLPQDLDSSPIQVLTPGASSNRSIATVSGNASLPTDAEIIRVANNIDMYLAFGDSGVTASDTDMLVLAGVEFFVVPVTSTHYAVINTDGSSSGDAGVTRMS
jgi:hypothetical protein